MTKNPRQSKTLPLIEETATVSKVEVTTGRVRVRTVNSSHEEAVRASLDSEAYEITRVPVDRPVAVAPPIRTEGDLTIIPVLEEVLVVEKRLFLKEEIHLTRRVTKETVDTSVTLRKQRAEVDHIDDNGKSRDQARGNDYEHDR